MKVLKNFSGLVLLAVLIMPFQNCTVYKSQGRKFLETNADKIGAGGDFTSSSTGTSSNQTALGKFTRSDCSPYLSSAEAQKIFGEQNLELSLYQNDLDGKLSCMVSSQSDSSSGLETVTCSISSGDYYLLTHFDGVKLADPDPDSALDAGAFGFTSTSGEASSVETVHFVGGKTLQPLAVHCVFSFADGGEAETALPQALDRGSQLVHSIVDAL